METKQHDWFATLMYQPDISIEKLNALGITPDTAALKPRNDYMDLPAVRKNTAFLNDDGEFDEKKFNKFYDSTLLLFNNYADLQQLGKIGSAIEYDPWAWYAPVDSKKRNVEPVAFINANPNRTSFSASVLKSIDPSSFSAREIAQDQYYFDTEKGEFSDKKPNDYVGIFKSFTAPNLVLATYDEDTPEIINGEEIIHPKGSYKLNPYGAPYYRTLKQGEEIYDKDLLHVTDIWSVDGLGWNKYDFFDADGITTEPWKVVVKSLVSIAPYLIPGNVGLVIKGLSAAGSLLHFMPTFLKAVDGIGVGVLGEGNALDNDFGQRMNQLETWLGKFDTSVSDRSREKLVTFENVGKLFVDVTKQLFEQKTIAQIPRIFKNVPGIYNNPALGRALSYAYMSATSSEESYRIFKNAGVNDVTAGLAMLGTMGMYYKLMSSDYFKDVLFKGTWLDEADYKRKTLAVLQLFKNATEKGEVKAITSPETAKATLNWFQRAWESVAKQIPAEGKGFALGALSEGVEEVMEEVGIDTIKGFTAALNALGVPVTRDNTELDFGYSLEDVTTRYLTSFVGGAFGGAVFHGYNLMDPEYRKNLKTSTQVAETPEAQLSEFVYLATQGRLKDCYKYAERLRQKGLLGSASLSGTKFENIDSIDGIISTPESSDNSISQNDLVFNEFVKQLKFIEAVMNDEGFSNARKEIENSLKLDKVSAGFSLFQSLGVTDVILEDVTSLGTRILETRAKIQSLVDSLRPTDENYDKAAFETQLKGNSKYKEWVDELKEYRKQFADIKEKKNISEYVQSAIIARNNSIMRALLGFATVDDFAVAKHGRHMNELTEAQKFTVQSEFDAYKNGEKRSILELSRVYKVLSERLKSELINLDNKLAELTEDDSVSSETYGNQYIHDVTIKARLEAKLKQLISKEDKTDEDVQQIASINKDLQSIDSLINALKSNPEQAFSQVETNPLASNTFEQLAQDLLTLYSTFRSKFKYGDGELNSFLYDLRHKYLNTDISIMVDEWIGNQDVDDAGPESFYNITSETPSAVKLDFLNLLHQLYSELDINPSSALNTYNRIRTLLKDRVGMDDTTIDSLLHQDILTGNIVEVENGDGVITKQQERLQLIPRLGSDNIFEFLEKINDVRKDIVYSNVTDLLVKFAKSIDDTDLISIMELLESEEKKIAGNIENYQIGDATINNRISKARTFLKAVFAAVAGAGNGANKIVNEYRSEEGKDSLAEISDRTMHLILKNIETLDNRLQFIQDLHNLNSGQKLRQQDKIGVNMRLKFLSELLGKVYIEDFKREFTKNGKPVDPAKILDEILGKDFSIDAVNTENFDEYEHKIVEVESELFNQVSAQGWTNSEIAKKLVNIYGKNSSWRQRSTKLTENKEETITDFDLIVYGAAVLSLHSGAFFYKYTNVLKKLQEIGDYDIVPVYGQENALRLIYAYAHNKDLFNKLNSEIAKTYTGKDKYLLNPVILKNLVAVFGGAGTGKTEGIGYMVSQLFDNCEFRFLGPKETQVSKLLKVFGRTENKEEGKTFDQFFEMISPEMLKSSNFKMDSDTNRVVAKNSTVASVDWFGSDQTKIRVLLIDESTRLNSVKLKVITDYAEKYDILVVALGDTKQTPAKITYETGKTTKGQNGEDIVESDTKLDGFEDTNRISTAKLTSSFRANNRAKNDNYDKLNNRLEVIENKEQSSEEPIDERNRDTLVEVIPITLHYLIDENHAAGDFITSDSEYFKTLLDRFVEKLPSEQKILCIVDSETIKKYNDPKYDEKVDFQDEASAQGGEYEYVFVDKSIPSSKYDALKDLYTVSQRGTNASFILDVNKFYKTELSINTDPRDDADLPYELNRDQKTEHSKRRLKSLEKIEKPDNYEELIKLPINTKVSTVVTAKKTEPEVPQETPPTSDPSPVEKPLTPGTEPESNDERPTPEVKEKNEYSEPEESKEAVPIAERKPIPLEDATKVTKTVFVDNAGTDTNATTNIPVKEDISEIEKTINGATIDTLDFYNLLFNQDIDFYITSKDDPRSLWNFLYDNGLELSKDEYLNVMLSLHNAILQNKTFNDILKDPRLGLKGYRAGVLAQILEDENLVFTLWNVNKDGENIITVRITNSIDNSVLYTVPVSIIKNVNLPTGRFPSGKLFEQVLKPRFKKGDFITVAELKAKYPWLRICTIGGIPIDGEDAQNSDLLNNATKDFLERKDGANIAFAYDAAWIDENAILRGTKLIDGTLYLYSNSDVVRAFGTQRLVDPKSIVAFNACIYWLSNKGHPANVNLSDNLKNALIKLGITDNTTSENITKRVCDWLCKITGSSEWSVLPGLFNNKKEYYEKLNECIKNNSLLSDVQNNRIITDVLISVLNGNESAQVNLHNLYYEFTKAEYSGKSIVQDNKEVAVKQSRRASIFLTCMGQTYAIKSYKEDGSWKLGLFKVDVNKNIPVGQALYSHVITINNFQEIINGAINTFVSEFDGMTRENFNSSNVIVEIREERRTNNEITGYFHQQQHSALYTLFGNSIINDDRYIELLNPNKFKYGIYGNVKKNEESIGLEMAPYTVLDEYVTDASIWYGSVFKLIEKPIEGELNDETVSERAIVYDELTARLKQLEYELTGQIENFDALAEELKTQIRSSSVMDDYLMDAEFQKFLNKINNIILNNTTRLEIDQFDLIDGVIVKRKLRYNFGQKDPEAVMLRDAVYSNFLRNKFKDISEELSKLVYSGIDFEVIENNNRYFIIYKSADSDVLDGHETATFTDWYSIMEMVNPMLTPSEITDYLNHLLTDSNVPSQIVDSYKRAIKNAGIDASINSFKTKINNYLEKRLQLEEC